VVVFAWFAERLDPDRSSCSNSTSFVRTPNCSNFECFRQKGHCASLGVVQDTPFDGTFKPWQTGQASTYAVDPSDQALYGQWPPTSIGLVANVALLPTYTATGAVPTLSTQSFPYPTATVDGGDGWFDSSDTAPGITTVAGCSYPNAWDATAVPMPTALCTGTP
jgi:glucan 1,3-beta-glucosidase